MKILYLSLIALGIIFVFSTSAYALPFPVLYMKSNTIGHIYVEYGTGHHNQTIKLGPMDIYDANLTNHVPLNLTDLSVIPNSTSITLDSNSTIVDYTVITKNNLNGIYALPVEHFTDRSSVVWEDPLKKIIRGYSKAVCYMIPLVIGLNSSQVSQDALDKFIFFNASENCPVPLVDRWFAGSQTIERMPGTYLTGVKLMDAPLKQFKSGIKVEDIKCADGFTLVTKSEDGSPTCVKPDTAQKLIERGWARDSSLKLPISSIQNQTRIPDYINKQNIPSSFTALSSTVFPTTTMESFDGVSVKGYLTNQNRTGLANQEIMFYLNNATLDNGTTISENLLMGNSTTDQTGCFYFADWDANKSLQFHNGVFKTNPSGNGLFTGSDNVLVYIDTIFAGTNNLLGSSNATKIMYHPIVPPIIREAGINAYLMNASSFFPHYSAVPILEVERGKSYNLTAFSSWSESLNVQTFHLEIKNLPCGINVPPVDVSDLKNKTQAVIPVKMIVDKTAPSGSFFPYVLVNNHVTQPLDLVVK